MFRPMQHFVFFSSSFRSAVDATITALTDLGYIATAIPGRDSKNGPIAIVIISTIERNICLYSLYHVCVAQILEVDSFPGKFSASPSPSLTVLSTRAFILSRLIYYYRCVFESGTRPYENSLKINFTSWEFSENV